MISVGTKNYSMYTRNITNNMYSYFDLTACIMYMLDLCMQNACMYILYHIGFSMFTICERHMSLMSNCLLCVLTTAVVKSLINPPCYGVHNEV